jgi:Xaa-Pro dipeptidase
MTMDQPDTGAVGANRRKIAPFVPAEVSWSREDYVRLIKESRKKATSLNQHALGYGALAEAEWKAAAIPDPDLAAMRRYRKDRVVRELNARDLDGVIVYDPVNIRYATDSTNMQLWVAHNATRFCFIGADGKTILFDYHASEHLSDHAGTVDEVRPCISTVPMYTGELVAERTESWANAIADLAREIGGSRLAFDHIDVEAAEALKRRGISVSGGQAPMEIARSIKSPDEILCMRRALVSCERAMAEMETAMQPGMSENELWAVLHHGNIVRGGEWIETRLLTSGPRTNPWFQECSSRIIEDGDLVSFDTDLIGPYGYCADISRTWLAGDGPASNEQTDLYRIAFDQIQFNMSLLKPGISARELMEKARQLPPDCLPNRYSVLYHGVGLCDEYPTVPYPDDLLPGTPVDDTLEPGMVICVESYAGRLGGREGVKLEEQVLITDTGHEVLSSYPWDERLLG